MSAASTLQFMQTGSNSSCGPTARPIAGHPNGFPPEGRVEAVSTKPIVRVAPPATERKVLLASQRAAQFGIAGDVVGGPHYRYPPGRARTPWFDTYGGGGRKVGLGVIDAIKHRRSGYAGTIIKTRRGTIVQTHSGVAGKSRADAIRLARVVPTRVRVPRVPSAPRAKDCLQGCWGIANREKYEACRRACICLGGYPSTCAVLQLAQRP